MEKKQNTPWPLPSLLKLFLNSESSSSAVRHAILGRKAALRKVQGYVVSSPLSCFFFLFLVLSLLFSLFFKLH